MKTLTKRKKRRFLRSPVMGLVYFLILVASCYFYSNKQKQERIKHLALSSAKITGFLNNGKGQSASIIYEYWINKKKYQQSRGSYNIFSNIETTYDFEGKIFPIVYDSLNPENSMLLIIPSDFEEYNLSFPDSLKWVSSYFTPK